MDKLLATVLAVVLGFAAGARADDKLADYYGFSGMEVYKVHDTSANLAVGDLNGDGRRDIAVVNNSQARIDLFYNRGTGVSSSEMIEFEENANSIRDDASFVRKDYLLDSKIVAFALDDVTCDGRLDLVYTTDEKKLCIVPQGENGWLEEKQLALKYAPINKNSLKICDLNQDGNKDILVVCSDWISIYYQSGQGEFSAPENFANLHENPSNILTGDFNGDGLIDLFTFYPEQQDGLSCRLQSSQGSFFCEIVLQMPAARDIAIYDADNDGICEIYAIQSATGRLKSYTLGKSDSTTLLGQLKLYPFDLNKPGGKRALTAGDIDGDGRADVVITEPSAAQIMFCRQLENGELAPPENFPCCEGASALFYLGKKRLLVFSASEQMIAIVYFEDRLHFPEPLETSGKLLCIECRDFNGDGLADIVYAAKIKNKIELHFLTQNADGKFAPKTVLKLGKLRSAPRQLKIIDLNQDEMMDVLLALPYVGTMIYIQQSDGKFEKLESQGGLTLFKDLPFSQIAQGDINGDSRKEVLVAKNNYVRALTISANGKIRTVDQYNSEDPNTRITAVAMADVTGDKRKEILLLDRSDLVIFEKNDDRYSETSRGPILSFNFRGWDILDLNGDGHKDILIAGSERFGIAYLNQVSYRLQEKMAYQCKIEDAAYKTMALGDINCDKQTDIVMVDGTHHMLDILTWSKGEIVSAMKFRIFQNAAMQAAKPQESGVREMVIADVNGDGKNDLLLLIHDRLLVYPQD